MTTPTPEEIAAVQAKTREINQTLKSDPDLRAKYVANPVAFLTGAGLPAAAAQSLVAHITREQDGGEVSGYDAYTDEHYPGLSSGFSSDDYDGMGGFTMHIHF